MGQGWLTECAAERGAGDEARQEGAGGHAQAETCLVRVRARARLRVRLRLRHGVRRRVRRRVRPRVRLGARGVGRGLPG